MRNGIYHDHTFRHPYCSLVVGRARTTKHTATRALEKAGEFAISAVSLYEIAWLACQEPIDITIPIGAWLEAITRDVLIAAITPAIVDTATRLPSSFPGDPADRIMYATAIEHGWNLVRKDAKLRAHRRLRKLVLR